MPFRAPPGYRIIDFDIRPTPAVVVAATLAGGTGHQSIAQPHDPARSLPAVSVDTQLTLPIPDASQNLVTPRAQKRTKNDNPDSVKALKGSVGTGGGKGARLSTDDERLLAQVAIRFPNHYKQASTRFWLTVAAEFQVRRGGIPYTSSSCARRMTQIENRRRAERAAEAEGEEMNVSGWAKAADAWIELVDAHNSREEAIRETTNAEVEQARSAELTTSRSHPAVRQNGAETITRRTNRRRCLVDTDHNESSTNSSSESSEVDSAAPASTLQKRKRRRAADDELMDVEVIAYIKARTKALEAKNNKSDKIQEIGGRLDRIERSLEQLTTVMSQYIMNNVSSNQPWMASPTSEFH